MRKLTLAIGAAVVLAAAPTTVLADQFRAVNELRYIVHVGCGNFFRALASGADTVVFECSQPITFQLFAGEDASALEHNNYCSDPTPVQRVTVKHRLPPSENWAFSKTCEAAP